MDKSHNWRQTNVKVHWWTECQSVYYDSAKNIEKLWEKSHNWRQTNKRVHWRTECRSVYYNSAKNCKRTQKKCGRMAKNQIYHWQTEWHSIYCKSAKNTEKLWKNGKQTDIYTTDRLNDILFTKLLWLCKEHKKLWQKALNDRKQTKLQFLDWLNDNVPFTKSKTDKKVHSKTEKLWVTLIPEREAYPEHLHSVH